MLLNNSSEESVQSRDSPSTTFDSKSFSSRPLANLIMARSAVDLDHDYASGLRPPITYDIVMESGIDLVGTTIMTWPFNFELGSSSIM